MSPTEFGSSELYLPYDKYPPFPVCDGELDQHFKVEDVFGYFIYYRERSAEHWHKYHVVRVEGLNQVQDKLEELKEYEVSKITRKFFWDENGQVREEIIARPSGDKFIKTVECDRTRIFCFDMTYLYSLNAEFAPTRYGGKRLSNEAKDQKQAMVDQSYQSELDGWMTEVYKQVDPCLSFELVSEFNHQFNRRDLSNMIKIPEDAIAEHILGINDARNYFVSNRKLYTRDESERLYLKDTLINYWM